MVIELAKISQKRLITIEDLKQNTGKPRRYMNGQNWRGLKCIAVADPDFELRWGPGFGLLALPAFLPSVISSFFHSK